jgi:malonyl CoA-acyl carrier protein transacylase
MLPTPNRDLPEVVSEPSIEMHEIRSGQNALSGRVDQLQRTVEEGFRLKREEIRQNTDRLIDAFSRSMAPLIERVQTHEVRFSRIVNLQA